MLSAQDWLVTLSVLGVVLSAYAVWVDTRLRKIVRYKPGCDISKKISCSSVFGSLYGHLLGISNAYIGLVGYAAIFVLATMDYIAAVNVLAFLAVAASLILAYWSYVKIKSFCLVCTVIYLINITLLFVSYHALR